MVRRAIILPHPVLLPATYVLVTMEVVIRVCLHQSFTTSRLRQGKSRHIKPSPSSAPQSLLPSLLLPNLKLLSTLRTFYFTLIQVTLSSFKPLHPLPSLPTIPLNLRFNNAIKPLGLLQHPSPTTRPTSNHRSLSTSGWLSIYYAATSCCSSWMGTASTTSASAAASAARLWRVGRRATAGWPASWRSRAVVLDGAAVVLGTTEVRGLTRDGGG